MATIKTVWTAAVVLLMLGCLEYVAILADVGFDLSQSPWVLLVVLAVPFAVVLRLLRRRPRASLVLMALMSGLVLAVLVVNIIQGGFATQGWADYLYVYVGGPVAAVGMIAAARELLARRRRPA
jgi:hypothetical protein